MRPAAFAAFFVVLALVAVHGQASSERRTTPAIKAGGTGELRTPWGDPDLQGTWSHQTLTPLERPAQFKDKPVLTEAEAAAYEKQLVEAGNVDNRTPRTVQGVNPADNPVAGGR